MQNRSCSFCCWRTLCTSSCFLKAHRVFNKITTKKEWAINFYVMLLFWLLIAISHHFYRTMSQVLKMKVFARHRTMTLCYRSFEDLSWDSCATNESVLITVMRFVGAGSRLCFFQLVILQDRPKVEHMVKIHFCFRRLPLSSACEKVCCQLQRVMPEKRAVNIRSLSSRLSETLNQWERREMKFFLDWITVRPKYKITCIVTVLISSTGSQYSQKYISIYHVNSFLKKSIYKFH